jgi:hypothetical protein
MKAILTHSFFFFLLCLPTAKAQDFYDTTKIQEIKLYFSQANWDYLLDTAASGAESYIFCRRIVINGIAFDSVGAKYKGNSSFRTTNAKNPWHIELDTYKDQHYQGYKDIKLSNIFMDASHVREVMSYEILQNYMDAPRANFARVWVNDTLIGLYTNTEAITKSFSRRLFQSVGNNNVLFKCNSPLAMGAPNPNNLPRSPTLQFLGDSSRYILAYELKTDFGWQRLVALTDSLNNRPLSSAEKVLDIDRAIWMLAFNNVLLNLDSYSGGSGHNYYLWQDDNGRFCPIVWDMNQAFASFTNTGQTGVLTDTANMPLAPWNLNFAHANRPLITKLMANATYRKMYIAHSRTILQEQFRSGNYITRGLAWQRQIDAAVQQDPNKFATYQQFRNNLYFAQASGAGAGGARVGIVNLMEARTRHLLDNTAEYRATQPTIATPSVSPAVPRLNDTVWITVRITHVNLGAYLGYRYQTATGIFQKTALYDDGLHRDGAANDGVYGAGIKALSAWIEYYIWAENDAAGIFLPQRAEHEFLSIRVMVQTAVNAGDIVLNELMADNTKTARNAKGDYADWIELYNRTNQALSLADVYMTDDKAVPRKWRFPAAATIPANGYLIVWADDDSTNSEIRQVHTNFKLSSSGETVFLTNAAGVVIDSVIFTKQRQDTAWARIPNGTGAFRFVLPTFNGTNVLTKTQEWTDARSLRIYPNPSQTHLTIVTTNYSDKTPLSHLTLFNAFGQMVLSVKEIESHVFNLNVADLPRGVYFLKVGEWDLRKLVLEAY